jgi:hypothetical protein
MARDPQSGSFNSKVVDEQTQAAAKRAAAKGPTPDEALLARAQAQIAKLKALPDPKATAAADRAAAVTAARLASSPIAQEAARTTAALKSFTAKGGLLGVPGSNIKTADPASLAKVGSNIFQMLGGVLYFSGVPFTGTSGNKKYENGIEVGTTGLADEDEDETTTTALKTDAQIAADAAKAQAQGERQSAYDLLYSQFKLYGLESLVEPLKGLITSGASPAEFTIKLRDSDAYKLRFAANAKRIANGFKAIDEATYLGLEDRYQSIMQNYGLPESYYKKGATGVQEGFEKFIANNVDPVTLEERIMEGVKINQGSKALIDTAKQFYPSLTDGDFLAYALDPKNALSEIRRKVTATEIGSAQIGAGLAATVGGAEELARAGITGKQYQQAAPTIAEASIRGGQLASIYKQDPYTQQTAEALLLDVPGSAEALKKTKKLTSLETAAFGGSAGAGAIARDRAGVL